MVKVLRVGVDGTGKEIADAKYSDWLERLLTHPVKGLKNFEELFEKLTSAKGAIKVFCEVSQ